MKIVLEIAHWFSRKFLQLDRLARVCLAVGVLLTCVGALFVIFVPENDGQQVTQFEPQDESDEAELLKASKLTDSHRAVYQACLAGARTNHEVNWAQACDSRAKQLGSRLSGCLTDRAVMTNPYMGKSYCDKAFGSSDPSPRCALPAAHGDFINQLYKDEQGKCLAEAKNAPR